MAKLTTYQVTEIAKDTWVINEAGMTAMFLLKGTERALLIDTGVGMTDLKKLISWLTPLPYDVVLTYLCYSAGRTKQSCHQRRSGFGRTALQR